MAFNITGIESSGIFSQCFSILQYLLIEDVNLTIGLYCIRYSYWTMILEIHVIMLDGFKSISYYSKLYRINSSNRNEPSLASLIISNHQTY